MNPLTVMERIQHEIPESVVRVEGADCNFQVSIVSESFSGQMPLQRQRRVLALFAEELRVGTLHALSIVAKTPEEARATQASDVVQLEM